MAGGGTVLVTGASGLLGRRLVPHLREAGHMVTPHVHSAAGERGSAGADLTEAAQTERLLAETRPATVVHLVGLTDVDRCEREPDAAHRLNVRTVANLVGAIRRVGDRAPHLVLISTDQVYDAPGNNREHDVLLRNTYALTKLWGEDIAATIGATVLRTNFFGRSHTPGRTSFTDWLVAAASSGKEMTLLTDVYFSPLSIETLSRAIEVAIRARTPGVFNAGSRHGMTKRDFAHAVARRLGLRLDRARDGSQGDLRLTARRPLGMMMDSGRFEQAFRLTLPTLAEEIQTAEL